MINMSSILGILGALSLVVNIIVEMFKYCDYEKKIPTQLVTIIVSLIICIVFVLIFCEITVKTIVLGIFMAPVVSFISMNGFDTFMKLWKRFQVGSIEDKGDDEE